MKFHLLVILSFVLSCGASKKISIQPDFSPGPHAIIYKTNADYAKNVPVVLNSAKTAVIAYPHPTDLKNGDQYLYPSALADGYLLDQKGIDINVAYLQYTYEQYAQLKEVPSLSELYESIIDKNPIVTMYDCGNKKAFTNLETQINQVIKAKKLDEVFKKIK